MWRRLLSAARRSLPEPRGKRRGQARRNVSVSVDISLRRKMCGESGALMAG